MLGSGYSPVRVSKVPAFTQCVWPFTYTVFLLLTLSPVAWYVTDEDTEAQIRASKL